MQSAPFHETQPRNAPFREMARRLRRSGKVHFTERRTLSVERHRKAQSVPHASRKGAPCDPQIAHTAPLRHVTAHRRLWGQPPRQTAGYREKWSNWANALEEPPARLRGGPHQGPQTRPGVWPHGKTHSALDVSRERRTLAEPPLVNLRLMPVDNYVVFYIPNDERRVVNVVRIIYGGRNIAAQLEQYMKNC